jgi:putative metal-binding protein
MSPSVLRAGLLAAAAGAIVFACTSAGGSASDNGGLGGGARPGCVPNSDTNGAEACNGLDDDCNGQVDDAPSGGPMRRACNSACGTGVEECVAGGWAYCTVSPSDETCNGVDDDCNGRVDEGCDCRHGETRPCGSAVGACRQGLEECAFGKWLGVCHGALGPRVEICGNGVDDDCNGGVDDDCACAPNQVQSCGSDVGACRKGTETCTHEGVWGTCDGAVAPRLESCNGADDDCDGQVDWSVALNRGWRADPREPMGSTCDTAIVLENAFENGGWIRVPVSDPNDMMTYPSIFPIGDEDWYRFTAQESGNGLCSPGLAECAFILKVELELKGAQDRHDYDFCVAIAGTCGEIDQHNQFCASDGDWNDSKRAYELAVEWGGICGADDSRVAIVFVRNKPNARSCGWYQLSAGFAFDSTEACP